MWTDEPDILKKEPEFDPSPEQYGARLNDNEMNDACEYVQTRFIVEQHAMDLYDACDLLRNSIRAALAGDAPALLRGLKARSILNVTDNIRLDLYNQGLLSKP